MEDLTQSGTDWFSKLNKLKQQLEDENRALSKILDAHDGLPPDVLKLATLRNCDQKNDEPRNEN